MIGLFGPPGAGKGTQSSLLIDKLGYKQISTGDLFRKNINENTELAVLAKSYMSKGSLVPDDVTILMFEIEFRKHTSKDIILDGFPRNLNQARELDKLLSGFDFKLDKTVFLNLPEEEIQKRLSGRRVCRDCGKVYHLTDNPSKISTVCDACNGELFQRDDDKIEIIKNRLSTYEENIHPLKEYYKSQGKYFEVLGIGKSTDIFNRICEVICS